MRKANLIPAGGAVFSQLPLGAGGAVTEMNAAADGTLVICGDVYNAWVRSAGGRFRPLFTSTSLPAGQFGPTMVANTSQNQRGCYAAAPAPSNSQVIYATWNGYVFKTTNQGASFTKLTGGPYEFSSDAYGTGLRFNNGRIAVHPSNANIFMVGPMEGKVIYSTDGSTLNTITVSAGTQREGANVPHFVAFDPTSSKCCYTINGFGIYESTTGPGGTFSLLSGSPATPFNVFYDVNGTLWALNFDESSGGNLYKKAAAGSFAKVSLTISPANTPFQVFGVDPVTPTVTIACGYDLKMYKSTNTGVAWDVWQLGQQDMFSTSIQWFDKVVGSREPNGVQIGCGKFQFYGGKVYCPNGFGVFNFTIPATTSDRWEWHEDSAGFEELEISNVCCVPNGTTFVSAHDRGVFRITDEANFKNLSYFGNNIPRKLCWALDGVNYPNSSSWWVDYVAGQPTHIVQSTSFFTNNSGKSTDDGLTWTGFGARPDGNFGYGQIVFASDSVGYHFSSNNQISYETTDGGATWHTMAEFPAAGDFGQSLWSYHRPALVDHNTGTVYAWNYGAAGGAGVRGIWKKPLGGSWSHIYSGYVYSNYGGDGVRFRDVPGQAGHFFYTAQFASPLMRTTNDCSSWSQVTNTSNCSAFGFGAAAPGQSYPAIYFVGEYSGQFGFWRSDDNFATTPKLLADYPMGSVDIITWVEPHPTIYGKGYIATGHSGVIRFVYDSSHTLN